MTELLGVLVVVVLLAFVVWFVGMPLRGPARVSTEHSDARRVLEAARDAKYREIRDNELDFRTGKLSEADFRQIDRALRAEAVEILRQLDQAAS